MNVFDLLAATFSLGATLASVILAVAALQFLRYFEKWRHEQRQATTVQVLAEYRDRIIMPTSAISSLSPEKLASVIDDDAHNIYRTELCSFLNSMEYLALLINSKAIDEEVCYRFLRGDVVSSFQRLLGHILAVREATNNPNIYSEYEALARKWGHQL